MDLSRSISEKIFTDAIEYASDFVDIDLKSIKIFTHCRKLLVFCEGEARSEKAQPLDDFCKIWKKCLLWKKIVLENEKIVLESF